MLNPWLIVGLLVVFGGAVSGAYIKGGRDALNAEAAQAARDQALADKVFEKAQSATAGEIAKIRITNKTVRQELEKEIIRDPIYTECVHPDTTVRMLNRSLQGPPGQQPGAAELPRDVGPAP